MEELQWSKDLIEKDLFPQLRAQGYACTAEHTAHGDEQLNLRVSRDLGEGKYRLTLRKDFWPSHLSIGGSCDGWVGVQSAFEVQDNEKPADDPLNVMLRRLVHGRTPEHQGLLSTLAAQMLGMAPSQEVYHVADLDPDDAAQALTGVDADNFFLVFNPADSSGAQVLKDINQFMAEEGPGLSRLSDVDLNKWTVSSWARSQGTSRVELTLPATCNFLAITLRYKDDSPVTASLRTFTSASNTLEQVDIPLGAENATSPGKALAAAEAWMQQDGLAPVRTAAFVHLNGELIISKQHIVAASPSQLVLQLNPETGRRTTVTLELAGGKVQSMSPPAKDLIAAMSSTRTLLPEHLDQYLRHFGNQLVGLAGEFREQMPRLSMTQPPRASARVLVSVAGEPSQEFLVTKANGARWLKPLERKRPTIPPQPLDAATEAFAAAACPERSFRDRPFTPEICSRPSGLQVLNMVLCQEFEKLQQRTKLRGANSQER